jgi:hypothetical protein
VARQPADRPGDVDKEDGGTGRTARTDAFWEGLNIDPVEIALPSGVGFTLRAYRMSSEVTASDVSERVGEVEMPTYASPFDDEEPEITDADLYLDDADTALDEEDVDLEGEAEAEQDLEETAEGDMSDLDDEGDEDGEDVEAAPDEEVPVFLSHGGQLLLFKSADSLVEFVKSGAANDMTQLDNWDRLVSDIRSEYVVALPEDQYEMDLVVNNLRGGPEAWDPDLLVQSGQLARDLGHALTIEAVVTALAPGSPLDDLDEALRGVAAGGVGTFFARRRARKVGKETASLAWRTVIGKISAVVDWRD